ncbi:MAG: transporter [Thermoproteota archaeon]|nr:transporter [Thermoproteota archaeon]
MLESLTESFKKLDRRVKVAIVATGLSNFGNRMTTRYDPIYSEKLGADPIDIGLLTSISQAASAVIAIPMGWAVENYSVKKVMLLNIALFSLHLALMFVSGNWLMLIPAYIISTRLLRMSPLADIIFVTAAEPNKRGTIISLARVIYNVLNIFAPIVAAIVITFFGGEKITAEGIRPLYFIELALSIFVFFLVARFLPPTLGSVDKKARLGSKKTSMVRDYLGALKGEKYLKGWVVLRIVQTFATSLVAPFAVLWLVDSKGADAYTFGVIGSTSLIVTLILQIPAGRLADKYGRRITYFTLRPMSYLGSFIAIIAQSPELLIFSALLGGYASTSGQQDAGISGVSSPLLVTWWWESVPEEKRGRFFGIEGLLGLAAIPASIIGGILWQQGYIMYVLLIPIVLEVAIVMPLLATVPDIIRSK